MTHERPSEIGEPSESFYREVSPLVSLAPQMHNYLHYFFEGIRWIPDELEGNYPNTEHPRAELTKYAQEQTLKFLKRDADVNEIMGSERYKDLMKRQRIQKGKAGIRVAGCIDGRKPYIHLFGWTAGVSETMAGVVRTYKSNVDGKLRLRSSTIEQSVSSRLEREDSEILEVFLAHEHCGAMEKWAGEGGTGGIVFSEKDDLIAKNLELFDNGLDAVGRRYNSVATSMDKPTLEKIGIKAVYNPETMGIEIGYSEGFVISTTKLAAKIARDLPEFHLKYRDNFNDLDKFLEKEQDVTDLIDRLYINKQFTQGFASATAETKQLKGLTNDQLNAARFILAKITANQILTGTYKHREDETKATHIHPFEEHAEEYMAITIDDGLNITVGQHDPGMQAFGASVPTVDEAVDHLVTEVALLEKSGKTKKPYIVFVSNGVAENMTERDSMKQARTVLATHFEQITESRRISRMIRSGILVPIPVIIQHRTNRIVEIPNLAL